MESSTPTEEFQSASEPATTQASSAGVLAPVAGATHEQCPACGAAMASDQRYCVVCGQRRGPARVPFLEETAQPSRETQPAHGSQRRRTRTSVDATLIAGIGTLLLAMGIGVLIGRSSNGSSSKNARVQVVTVAGGGGASSGATGSAANTTTSATTAPSTTKSAASSAKVSATLAAKKAAAKAPKVVTVGSSGHGPGYQHGHFTGNFFGP